MQLPPLPSLAQRVDHIAPFYVMELAKQAAALAAQGRDIIAMNIGEPDFTAPDIVLRALDQAAQRGQTQYTSAMGITSLREAIAGWYASRLGVQIDPSRIIVTAGASAALLLACAALVNPGDGVLMPDPCYPCNRHFVASYHGVPQLIACDASKRFQLTAADVVQHWTPSSRGVLLATPSNPTGTSILNDELLAVVKAVQQRGGFTIVDEIYQGLSYDRERPPTALALPDGLGDSIVSVNSFSKYFHMTGWRLGWLVVPQAWVPAFEKLAQNFFICASALAQQAALACFTDEALGIYEARKAEFRQRRDLLIPALNQMGLTVPVMPDGAFYAYADISRYADLTSPPHAASSGRITDSMQFARRMLEEAGIAATPGKDFGYAEPQRYLRFSYATALPRIEQALDRLQGWLPTL